MSENNENLELTFYYTITPFQKTLVDSLKTIGFVYQYPKFYTRTDNYITIDVTPIKNLSQALNFFLEEGQSLKAREIRKVLNIV